MNVNIESQWKKALEFEFEKTYFGDLVSFVKKEYRTTVVYPPAKNIFSAFELTPFEQVKLVIIGQDPYHGPNQANGLSFSVADGVKIPPSLKNIYKELKTDIGKETPSSGNLESWARQGVLLLNATLTVRASQPGSHQNKGWETFTDAVIQKLSDDRKDLIFLLWGSYAQRKGNIIDREKHYVIEAPHPSPLAAYRGFFGSKPFSKINYYLEQKGLKKINW